MVVTMERLITSIIISFLSWTSTTLGDDFCLRESVNISCSSDEVVLITSAQYGRMRGGRCIRGDVGATGCSSDVLPLLDEVCSGRQRCAFPVANLLQHKPCPDDFTPYLETHHTCLRVSQSRCTSPDGMIVLTEQDGFVPLSIHSFKCPWRVKVDQQQTLQFTLFSFGQRRVPSDCPWSVLFNEAGRTMEHPLCHAASRETAVYTSRSNAVTVRVSYKENVVLPLPYFLKYEAVGCPQLRVPGYAWVRQDEARATVKCNQTEETWFLACSDRRWHGEIGNCSKPLPGDFAPGDPMSNVSKVTSLPFGFMIAVIIGVLLGIVIGAIPLAIVYACLKRKWRHHQPSYHVTEDPYYPGIQHTFVEAAQQASSIYPALLKRPATQDPTTACHSPKRNGPQTTGAPQRCYGCSDPLAYDITAANTTDTPPPNQRQDKQSTRDNKSSGRHQIECCRVLECPDVMTHVVTLHSGGGGSQCQTAPADLIKTGPVHHYESAAFCRGHVVPDSVQTGDYAPGRRGSDNVHCYRAVVQDQSKHRNDDLTELGDEYRSTVQPL